MGSVYGFYQSWVSHVGNIRYDHATETELVVLLLVRYFLGDLFFPSNARWLSPGRLSSRKDNCIVQIHRINAVETLVIMTI